MNESHNTNKQTWNLNFMTSYKFKTTYSMHQSTAFAASLDVAALKPYQCQTPNQNENEENRNWRFFAILKISI